MKARALGAEGEAWLAGLPDLVAEFERRWSVRVERSLPGGTAAYVARARTTDDLLVVMKLSIPDPAFALELGTLARAEGRGYVQLLAHDMDRYAMLLEGLGPSMDRTDMSPESQIVILCRLLAQAWAIPPAETGAFAAPRDKATDLARMVNRLWHELDGPCSKRALTEALQFAERRAMAFDPDRCVVVHGDAAPNNALQALVPRPGAETGFVFVDPDGFIGDPAYDLGVALRDWCPQLLASPDARSLARRYSQLLADGSGIDEQAIWEWGFLERVSTGMYALAIGARDVGRSLLDTAEQLL
jgi:streptomycin 6-kinase